MRLLVTGGCGFIGSNFVRFVLEHYQPAFVTNVDVLTYAGNPENLAGLAERLAERYEFFQSDIARPRRYGDDFRQPQVLCGREFRGGVACGPQHFRAGKFHSHERHRHGGAPRGCAQAWGEAVSAGLDGRGLRLARDRKAVHGEHSRWIRVRRIRRARRPRICWRWRLTRRSGRRL